MAEDQVVKQDGLTQENDPQKKKASVKRKSRRVSSKKNKEKSEDKKSADKKSVNKESKDRKVADIGVSSDSIKKKTRRRRHRKKKSVNLVDAVATESTVPVVDNSVGDDSVIDASVGDDFIVDDSAAGKSMSSLEDGSVAGDAFQDEEMPEDDASEDVNDDVNDDVSGDVSDDTNTSDSFGTDDVADDATDQVSSDVQKDAVLKEPVGWDNSNGLADIGGTHGAADAAATHASATDWFGAPVSTGTDFVATGQTPHDFTSAELMNQASSAGQIDQNSVPAEPESQAMPFSAPEAPNSSGQTPDWFSAPTPGNDFSNQSGESTDSTEAKNDDMHSSDAEFGSIDNSNQSEPTWGTEFMGKSDESTEKSTEESAEESESVEKSESIDKSESTDESEIQSDTTPSYKSQVATVQDVTDQSDSSEDSVDQDGSDFMDMLAEAGIKKKHLFIIGGVFLSILLAIFVFIFTYDFGGEETKSSDDNKETVEVNVPKKSDKVDDKNSKNDVTDKDVADEKNEDSDLTQVDDFQISGLVNSYIFGLEFTQNRVLQMLDTTPISDEGTLIGIDSSLAVGQDLQFKQEIISRNLDLLLKIENARSLNIYDYLNKTTDRVAALNEHIRDLQSLLTQAEASKNAVVAQVNILNTEYTQITAQKNAYEKAFFDSMGRYYGNDSYNNLTLFTEASQLQVKVKANYNALKTLNAMFDTSIKTLKPRINDIVANFDALVKGVQVTEVKNSNINAIKF